MLDFIYTKINKKHCRQEQNQLSYKRDVNEQITEINTQLKLTETNQLTK